MTINKAQGQTLPNVGVYLPEPVFSHGQLYVALSRATAWSNIRILAIPPSDKKDKKKTMKINGVYTKNIVYKEVLTLWKGIAFCFAQLCILTVVSSITNTFLYISKFQVIEKFEKKWETSSVWWRVTDYMYLLYYNIFSITICEFMFILKCDGYCF